jgi:hypothetical protein
MIDENNTRLDIPVPRTGTKEIIDFIFSKV